MASLGLLLLGLVLLTSAAAASGPPHPAPDWSDLLGAAVNQGDIDWGQLIASASGGDWGSLVGAALGGHRHSEDPDEEDLAGHLKHSAATTLFTTWLQSLWSQVPEEWSGPVEEVLRRFPDAESLAASLENPHTRRTWIRALSGLASHWLKHLSRPDVQARWGRSVAGWLGGRWDGRRPVEESLPQLLDSAAKLQLGVDVKTSSYLAPALRYVAELVRAGEGQVTTMSTRELDDKLAEGLNSQVIETALRVWRAHKYSIASPRCDARILCEINSKDHFANSNSTLKPAVTKIASLVSAWFLSGHTGTPFLELYAASTENYNCEDKYPINCSDFHEEDLKITTSYYHNEL